MKIKVTPEGRDGVWEASKESVVEFLREYKFEQIHNYIPGQVMLGADWNKSDVIDKVNNSERIAVLTGEPFWHNMRHALSVIVKNKLFMFDIGELKESDLEV